MNQSEELKFSELLEAFALTAFSIYMFVIGYLNSLGILEKPSLIEAAYFYLQVSLIPLLVVAWEKKFYALLIGIFLWKCATKYGMKSTNKIIERHYVIKLGLKRKHWKLGIPLRRPDQVAFLLEFLLLLAILGFDVGNRKAFAFLLLLNVTLPSLVRFELLQQASISTISKYAKIFLIILFSSAISYSLGFNFSGKILEFGGTRNPNTSLVQPFLWRGSDLLYLAKCTENGEWQVRGYHGKEHVFTSALNREQHKNICRE